MKRSLFVTLLFFFFVGILFVPCCQAAQQIVVTAQGNTITKIEVDGQQVSFPDTKPFIDQSTGRTMVPVRFIAEALGSTVEWNQQLQQIVVLKGNTSVKMCIGSINYYKDGNVITSDAAPQLYNGRTMVPLRIISELFGAQVSFNSIALPTPAWANDPTIPDMYKQMLLQVPDLEQATYSKLDFRYKNLNLNAHLYFSHGTEVNVIRVSVWTFDIGRYKFEPEIRTHLINSLRPVFGDKTEEIVQSMDDKPWGPPSEFNCNGMRVEITSTGSKDCIIWY